MNGKMKELEERIHALDRMVASLAELLEEKRVLAEGEWDRRIAERLKEEVGLVRV